jgi:hypothetical protein
MVFGSALFSPHIIIGKTDSSAHFAQGEQTTLMQSYRELFELSHKEKKGLTFFVKGQTIAGIVTKLIGNEAIEVRSQTYSRVIIRVDSIDAVAMN